MDRIISKRIFKELVKKWMRINGFKIKYRMGTSCGRKELFLHYTIKDINNDLYKLIVDGRDMKTYQPAKISISKLIPISKNSFSQEATKVFYLDIDKYPLYN